MEHYLGCLQSPQGRCRHYPLKQTQALDRFARFRAFFMGNCCSSGHSGRLQIYFIQAKHLQNNPKEATHEEVKDKVKTNKVTNTAGKGYRGQRNGLEESFGEL